MDQPAHGYQMRHKPFLLAIGLVCCGFALFALVAAHLSRNGTSGPIVEAIFLTGALLGAFLVYVYFRDRPVVSEEGISAAGVWPAPRDIRWADVVQLRFDGINRWFVIKDAAGRTIRVSIMLAGLAEFARLAARHVPQSAFAPKLAYTLQYIADRKHLLDGGA